MRLKTQRAGSIDVYILSNMYTTQYICTHQTPKTYLGIIRPCDTVKTLLHIQQYIRKHHSEYEAIKSAIDHFTMKLYT